MSLRRKQRVVAALIALFSMLFMQLAVASYACPGVQAAMTDAMSDDAAAMPDCEDDGASRSALCHAHCQDGKSSLDKPEVRTVAPAAGLLSAIVVAADPAPPGRQAGFDSPSLLRRTTAPPISIRHCCFRI
jgi:hypothetical protein